MSMTEEKKEIIFDDGRIEAMKEFVSPGELYQDLIERVHRYHPSDDISLIDKAYRIAEEAHRDQVRKSGEPYIIHPLCVGIILADLELDKETIAAGLLHDVVEDTIMTDEEIKEEYNTYLQLYKEFNSDKEGIRIVEKTMQKNNTVLTLKFIPFEAGADFVSGLKEAALSSIFVSATLSSGGNFEYFLKETGLDGLCETHILENVFDFHQQGRLFVPNISSFKEKDKVYKELISNMSGSALIICNSLERMQYIEQFLRRLKINKKIYTQSDVNIGELDFCNEDMVLIGSATLREGIDISGGGFKAVILDQLPFEYHKDIILQSKAEQISENSAKSFIDFFLPRAVLYFKQAVGRLIRHEDDYGLWVVLDNRILNKNYGKYFLDVIYNVEIIEDIEKALYFIKEEKHG